ncbi:hypothetical protein ZWY2020_019349 [Hordeum vulgare]|nr:hypothetical protein ZWY2020_019349 [Hordeum vulgare]
MESPPLKRNVAQDDDIISALTDDLLLAILERLDLRDAVRAGAVSTRWRHLPHRLSRLELDAGHFGGATLVDTMDAFTSALLFVCPPAERDCDCHRSRVIKTLDLSFYLLNPHLISIGSAIEDVISRGKTTGLALQISPPPGQYTAQLIAMFGQMFMSFSRAYQVAFRWLTRLCLKGLAFEDSDVTDLINACDGLKQLTLSSCWMVEHPVLKIDTPCSGLQELKFIDFGGKWIELVSVPKLRQVTCLCWRFENPPVRFGYVPELRDVTFTCQAKAWQAPFLLSQCLSTSVTNPWKLHLHFAGQMIWIQPEHPKQLTAIFRNLTGLSLLGVFPECDLSWTLFILEAAPALQFLSLSQDRHSCVKTSEDSAEKTNVVWEPSKDLKHLNLKVLQMYGFEEDDKVTNYIRLIMERAVGLKIIILRRKFPCKECNDIELEKGSEMNEASWCRVKKRLTNGSYSSVEIIIC